MVVNIDFTPTLLEMAGISIPPDIQGKSFASRLITNKSDQDWRKAMYYHYYEYPRPHNVAPHFGIRTMRYKLIRFYGPFDAWELFDLNNDKTESNNLYGKPEFDTITLQLKLDLVKLAKEYKDDLAVGILEK